MTWILFSICLFSTTPILWTFVFSRWIDAHSTVRISFQKLILGHLACLLGSLTPGNLGAETLRVLFNKKWIQMNWMQTFYVSSLTSAHKLNVSIAIVILSFICFGPYEASYIKALIEAIVFLACVLVVLKIIRRKKQATDPFFSPTKSERISAAAFFSLSYGLEFFSFVCCLKYVSITIPLTSALAAFSIVHVLARIPLLPQGIVVTEALGYFLLDPIFPLSNQKVTLLATWGFVRILSPHIVGVIALLRIKMLKIPQEPSL